MVKMKKKNLSRVYIFLSCSPFAMSDFLLFFLFFFADRHYVTFSIRTPSPKTLHVPYTEIINGKKEKKISRPNGNLGSCNMTSLVHDRLHRPKRRYSRASWREEKGRKVPRKGRVRPPSAVWWVRSYLANL